MVEGTEQGYKEVTLLVEGAVEEIREFGPNGEPLPALGHEESFDTWLGRLISDATAGFHAEVFVLAHGHPMEVDDEEVFTDDVCAQYVTDGRPDYVFN
jgi:hypothetical protein